MSKAFGIINFAGNNIQVNDMQAYRPIGAFSFLGRYRVIDFPISNMSNSGIDVMQVFTKVCRAFPALWLPLRRANGGQAGC